MDTHAIEVLEFDKIKEMVRERTVSAFGRHLADRLRPETDLETVRRKLQETTEAKSILQRGETIPLPPLPDLRPQIKRASLGGYLSPTELLKIREAIISGRRLKQSLTTKEDSPARPARPLLRSIADRIPCLPEIEKAIGDCIDEKEEVRDNASPELSGIRVRIRKLHTTISNQIKNLLLSPEYRSMIQDRLVVIRQDRYCIPIKAEWGPRFKGLILDRSDSGATLFGEPARVVPLNNELIEKKAAEKREIIKILTALSQQVGQEAEDIRAILVNIGIIDFITARAQLGLDLEAVEPELNTAGCLNLIGARHPLLDKRAVPAGVSPGDGFSTKKPGFCVPIDVSLGDGFTTLVITGPNTGGKTVSLKTIGLFTLMAQAGLLIPAKEGSSLAVFKGVFADIGDEQAIEQNLSTFSSHLKQIVKIIQKAGPDCLVLIDEIGTGTDPGEGAALAQAILQHLHDKSVRTVVTTHSNEIKRFAYLMDGMENACCQFDQATLKPTYKLAIGFSGESNAFAIAAGLGLPKRIIAKARSLASAGQSKVSSLLSKLSRDYQAAAEEKMAASLLKEEAARLKDEYAARQVEIKQKRAGIISEAQREARDVIYKAEKGAKEILAQLRQNKGDEAAYLKARQSLTELAKEFKEEETEKARAASFSSGDFALGDEVLVGRLEARGVIVEAPGADGNLFTIQAGGIKLRVSLSELKLTGVKKTTSAPLPGEAVPTSPEIPDRLYLLGLSREEALIKIEGYLSEAAAVNLSGVYLVHGKGAGILRAAIHRYLEHHPQVESFRLAEPAAGGSGVTQVKIRIED
ncbi:MAG: endonuclease MutS2 [bacterium]|nr:endonuclease MutS2 [bacterium]